MPLYPLRCVDCGRELERYAPMSNPKVSTSCSCGGLARRVWTPPAVISPFRGHFNHSVGQYVGSMTEFRDALKHGEDDAGRRGLNARYEAVDPRDMPRSEEGLAEQAKAHRDAGWTEPKGTIFTS